ncbi:uncharacterized protein SCHCODRAFT_01294158 [Schizophyllum commune H4-8]|nr:uncharacterized protein SCHCODRAFT_01294158 [Schizophyllum commune H4-8]KAI5896798.1 hypothetical protein SCHCODRAFT_01294158 [Schizophyllum commune H4-8]
MQSIENALKEARAVANAQIHRTHFVPTEHDARVIREKAQALRDLQKNIDKEIEKLLTQKRVILAQLPAHDALLSVWRRLPPEILSEIFTLALPDDWDDEPAGRRVLNFACVCAMWRSVALNTPSLWTSLWFGAEGNPLAGCEDRLAVELARTGQAPLKLTVDMELDASVGGAERIAKVARNWSDRAWTTLCAQAHRWEEVALICQPLHAYAALAHHELPVLRRLFISMDAGASHVNFPVDVFARAENLTSFTVQYLAPPRRVILPRSWALTELSIVCGDPLVGIYDPPLAPFLDAIAACSSTLRYFELFAEDLGSVPDGPPIVFPVLERLLLQRNAISFCRNMSTPCLGDAVLDGLDLAVLDSFMILLRQSSECKSLHRLALKEVEDMKPSAFVACMQAIPHLTELELYHLEGSVIDETSPLSVAMLATLSRDSGVEGALTLLPNLERLRLDFNRGLIGDEDEHEDADELRKAVYSIPMSRKHQRTVDGQVLASLEGFTIGINPMGLHYP